MEKKLQDYLHYYMGCNFLTNNSQGEVNPETIRFIYPMIAKDKGVQLILRRLEDITKDDLKQMIIKLSLFDLSKCEFEFDENWVNAIRNGVVIDCLTIETNGQIDMMKSTPSTNPQADAFHYLLQLGFDIFGLIDSGLAIDASTLTK